MERYFAILHINTCLSIAFFLVYLAMKAYEDHIRNTGEQVSHPRMKEMLAAFATAEVDKLFQTHGLDFLDREQAKRRAVHQAHHLAEERYGPGNTFGNAGGDDYQRRQGQYGGDDYQRGQGQYGGDDYQRGQGQYGGDDYQRRQGQYGGDDYQRGQGQYGGDNYQRDQGQYGGDGYQQGQGQYGGNGYQQRNFGGDQFGGGGYQQQSDYTTDQFGGRTFGQGFQLQKKNKQGF
jgi:hypothetical protein